MYKEPSEDDDDQGERRETAALAKRRRANPVWPLSLCTRSCSASARPRQTTTTTMWRSSAARPVPRQLVAAATPWVGQRWNTSPSCVESEWQHDQPNGCSPKARRCPAALPCAFPPSDCHLAPLFPFSCSHVHFSHTSWSSPVASPPRLLAGPTCTASGCRVGCARGPPGQGAAARGGRRWDGLQQES